jgi:ubiquitin-protein ligase
MSNVAQRRINNELKAIQSNNQYSHLFKISSDQSNMYIWNILMQGPQTTVYENYSFNLRVEFTDEYPLKPPNVKFLTSIQHININPEGDICLDSLKNKWTSSSTMINIILSIISLLIDPNPSDPFNPELAELYTTDVNLYNSKIKQWCDRFATKTN